MRREPLRISENRVKSLVNVKDSLRLVREAYIRLAENQAVSPERVWLSIPDGVSVFCMPAYLLGRKTVSVKVARLNPRNQERLLPSVMATIYVYDSTTGRELAQVEAGALTSLRTAASSAVATDLLARRNAETLGIIGTGIQAEAHIPALLEVRKISKILVYSRRRSHREDFAQRCVEEHGISVIPANSPREVVESSDILVLATNSQVPLFKGELVRPGTHVNAIGAALPDAREVDTFLAKRSVLVVDSKAQAMSSYGDIRIPLRERAIKEADMKELGELLLDPSLVARKNDDITLFKSGGLAVLDAIIADHLLSKMSQPSETIQSV